MKKTNKKTVAKNLSRNQLQIEYIWSAQWVKPFAVPRTHEKVTHGGKHLLSQHSYCEMGSRARSTQKLAGTARLEYVAW